MLVGKDRDGNISINIIEMGWTSHDQFFGWVHSFRINRNNFFFGGRFGTNEAPYPVIVHQPSFTQVIDNWNSSDTGLVVSFFLGGLLLAKRWSGKELLTNMIVTRRNDYRFYHRIITAFGFFLALRNSAYRLEGLVPNGLPKKKAELVKYDYTTELVNSTFWKYFIETHDKPRSQ